MGGRLSTQFLTNVINEIFMKILIIIPTSGYPNYPLPLAASDFPTGFAYIAAALKKAGHEVIGVNPNNDFRYKSAQELIENKIDEKIALDIPDIVCIGGLCTEYNFINDVIKIIRNKIPSKQIVCGGGIINNDAEFIFNKLDVDFCVIGEGEKTIVKLLNEIKRCSNNFASVDNIGYKKEGKAYFSKIICPKISESVDDYAFPDYDPFDFNLLLDDAELMIDRNLYRYTRTLNPRPMPIVTARGCPFKCTFCVHESEIKYRARSMENIFAEIKDMHTKYNFNILIIVDELFAASKKRLKDFCEMVHKGRKELGWDFDWMFQTHANAALDENSLKMAKEAGCYFFSYGIESASQKVLNSMNKKSNPQQISKALLISQKVKIGFGGNYIFGDPKETIETIQESLDFIYQHRNYNIFFFFIGFIIPYPGSKIFKLCIENGIIKNKLAFYEERFPWINMSCISNDVLLPIHEKIKNISQTMTLDNNSLISKVKANKVKVYIKNKNSRINTTPKYYSFLNNLLFKKNRIQLISSFFIMKVFKRKIIEFEIMCPKCKCKINGCEPFRFGRTSPVDLIGCPHCNSSIMVEYTNSFLKLKFFVLNFLVNIYKLIKKMQLIAKGIKLNKSEENNKDISITIDENTDKVNITIKNN